jgi:hypothetical protein
MPKESQPRPFSGGPVREALRITKTSSMVRKSKKNFSQERRIVAVHALGLCHQYVYQLVPGKESFSDTTPPHLIDMKLKIPMIIQTI